VTSLFVSDYHMYIGTREGSLFFRAPPHHVYRSFRPAEQMMYLVSTHARVAWAGSNGHVAWSPDRYRVKSRRQTVSTGTQVKTVQITPHASSADTLTRRF
jgi:hypothetical protein